MNVELTDAQLGHLQQALATADADGDLILTDLRVTRALERKGVVCPMPEYCHFRLTEKGRLVLAEYGVKP